LQALEKGVICLDTNYLILGLVAGSRESRELTAWITSAISAQMPRTLHRVAKLFDRQPGVTDNPTHRNGIDRIVTRNGENTLTVATICLRWRAI